VKEKTNAKIVPEQDSNPHATAYGASILLLSTSPCAT